MALNIKNVETERFARELARLRKQSIAEVVTDALRKKVERESQRPREESREVLWRVLPSLRIRYNYRSGLGFSDKDRAAAALKGIEGKRLTYRRPH